MHSLGSDCGIGISEVFAFGDPIEKRLSVSRFDFWEGFIRIEVEKLDKGRFLVVEGLF